MALYDVWTFPLEVVEEVRAWWIFRSVSRSPAHAEKLASHVPELRVDNLGRVYTVVNVPEEMRVDREGMDDMRMQYVLDSINSMNYVLMEMRLSDVAYPEVYQVPGTWSYLVTINATPGDVITWFNIGKWLAQMAVLVGTAWAVDRVLRNFTGRGIVGNAVTLLGG